MRTLICKMNQIHNWLLYLRSSSVKKFELSRNLGVCWTTAFGRRRFRHILAVTMSNFMRASMPSPRYVKACSNSEGGFESSTIRTAVRLRQAHAAIDRRVHGRLPVAPNLLSRRASILLCICSMPNGCPISLIWHHKRLTSPSSAVVRKAHSALNLRYIFQNAEKFPISSFSKRLPSFSFPSIPPQPSRHHCFVSSGLLIRDYINFPVRFWIPKPTSEFVDRKDAHTIIQFVKRCCFLHHLSSLHLSRRTHPGPLIS